jgi:uncharacterized membrane protein
MPAMSTWLPWALLYAVFAGLFLGERTAPRDSVGIALVGGGVLLLSPRR